MDATKKVNQVIYYEQIGNRIFLRVSLPEFDSVGKPIGKIIEDKLEIPSTIDGPAELQKLVDEFRTTTQVSDLSEALKELLSLGTHDSRPTNTFCLLGAAIEAENNDARETNWEDIEKVLGKTTEERLK